MSGPAIRVLAIDQAGEPGGAQLCLLDAAAAFAPGELSVLLLADGPFRAMLEGAGLPVAVAPGAGGFVAIAREAGVMGMWRGVWGLLRAGVRAAALARRHDVIYANSQKALLVGALAAVLSGRRLVWHLHDVVTVAGISRAARWIARVMANGFACRVIVNSRATRAGFRAIGGTVPARLIYNGVDLARFDPALPARSRPAGVPDGAPLLGVFGRLTHLKGQHIAIAALAHLPGVHLLLVGGPLFGQEAYETGLRQQAVGLGLGDRVHFAGHQADVGGWMRACDAVLHTSVLAEAFGRVIVEAMATAKPVIASAEGGVLEIIADGHTGLLVPPGDALALAGAVRRLLDQPEWAGQLARAGRDDVRRRFGLRRYGAGVRAVLRSAAAGPPGRYRGRD